MTVLRCRFYYYSGAMRPTGQEVIVTEEMVCHSQFPGETAAWGSPDGWEAVVEGVGRSSSWGSMTLIVVSKQEGTGREETQGRSVDDFTGGGTRTGGGHGNVGAQVEVPEVAWICCFAFEKLALGTGPSESTSPGAKMQGTPGECPALSAIAHPRSARKVNGPK